MCAALAAAGGLALFLLLTGRLRLNNPSRREYPVWGVDVSSWQGEIGWEALAAQGVDFAYIKATEGSAYRDPRFDANWEGARAAGIYAGAYHFFSYDSPGETQAENFIGAAPDAQGALPPVVDVEFYGGNGRNPPPREQVEPELKAMLEKLEAHYGAKPMLYATGKAYRLYLEGDYEEYPIWIRSVASSPSLADGREWTVWQFSSKGRLTGYTGDEPYIDLNVYRGSREEFLQELLGQFPAKFLL